MRNDLKALLAGLAIAALAVPAVAQGAGKVIFHDISITAAPNAAKDDAHKETIEIQSWSLGATNSAPAGKGTLTLVARSVPASVARLCQSRQTLPSMTLEADGQRRELRKVVFQQCPAGGNGTYFLAFEGFQGGVNVAAADVSDAPNVTITGMTRSRSMNNLKQMSLAAHSATFYIGSANGGVWKTTNGDPLPARGQQFPLVVVEGKGGTRVTFTKVTFGDLVISSAQAQTFTIQFESTTATQALIDAILAGR